MKNRRIRLAWIDNGSANFMERADVIGLGISYDMLHDALLEAEDTLDANGRYPINETMKLWLRKLLNVREV